jgi:ABC-2 type transport system ATP-binding protein
LNAIVTAKTLSKRYGRLWGLRGCTLTIPGGRVVGLVGPNGAGKTTLLNLVVGLISPTGGSIEVLGDTPAAALAQVGYVAQETPVYARLAVDDHLRLGAHLNPTWDAGMARSRIKALGLDEHQSAGSLSGGQRAQLALTLAIAKRPRLLVLDEPVASLDPLARRDFLAGLMELVAAHEVSVILSSHLVADLERVCDHLIVLVESRVQVAGDIDSLLATHQRLVGPRRDEGSLPADQDVIESSHTDRQSTLLVRSDGAILDPSWSAEDVSLEDLVLAYMSRGSRGRRIAPAVAVMR